MKFHVLDNLRADLANTCSISLLDAAPYKAFDVGLRRAYRKSLMRRAQNEVDFEKPGVSSYRKRETKRAWILERHLKQGAINVKPRCNWPHVSGYGGYSYLNSSLWMVAVIVWNSTAQDSTGLKTKRHVPSGTVWSFASVALSRNQDWSIHDLQIFMEFISTGWYMHLTYRSCMSY